jgi:hypothetical protein
MTVKNEIKLFEQKVVRSIWDAEQEKWFMSIVDVVSVLTESPNPRKYWSVLKSRLKVEGSQLATNCSQLKMKASTKDISAAIEPENFEASKKVAKQGGNVAKVALKELEARTGKQVVSSGNAKSLLGDKSNPILKKVQSPKKKK